MGRRMKRERMMEREWKKERGGIEKGRIGMEGWKGRKRGYGKGKKPRCEKKESKRKKKRKKENSSKRERE